MATPAQKAAVVLAFVAAAVSFTSVAVRLSQHGELGITPLAGGLLMLVLAIGGVMRLRNPKR